jgi:hypothetical protein
LFVPLPLQSEEVKALDVTLLELGDDKTLPGTAHEVEIVPGFFVNIGSDIIELPFGSVVTDLVSGVFVPEEHRPPVALEGTVIGMWYLEPYDATAEDGLAIRILDEWSTAQDTTYEVKVASYAHYSWLDAGSLTLGADGFFTGDAKLPVVSTVVLLDTTTAE